MIAVWILAFVAGVALIVWGAEAFAEHLGAASVRLGVSTFALALLLAGAEPEELATVVVASLPGSPGIAVGDVIGANVAICLVALGVGAVIAPLPFRASVMRCAIPGVPLGAIAAWIAWDGAVPRGPRRSACGILHHICRRYLDHRAGKWSSLRGPAQSLNPLTLTGRQG